MNYTTSITTYRVINYGSAKFQMKQKVHEMFFAEGVNKLTLDNRNSHKDKFISYIDYNANEYLVILVTNDGQLYNPMADGFYIYPEGFEIVPKKKFTQIIVIRKTKEHFNENFSNCNYSLLLYVIILFVILYFVHKYRM